MIDSGLAYHLHDSPHASNGVAWLQKKEDRQLLPLGLVYKILQESTFRWLAMYLDHGFSSIQTFTHLYTSWLRWYYVKLFFASTVFSII